MVLDVNEKNKEIVSNIRTLFIVNSNITWSCRPVEERVGIDAC